MSNPLPDSPRRVQTSVVEIARLADCAPSTVSRALRDDTRISAATRQRIQEIARRLDYRPNSAALALLRGHDQTIGFIVPNVFNAVYYVLWKKLEQLFTAQGFYVFLADSQNSPAQEAQIIESFLQRRAAGLVIVPVTDLDERASTRRYRTLQKQGCPFILLGPSANPRLPHVCGADEDIARALAVHLLEQGAREVLFVPQSPGGTITQARLRGLRSGLHGARLEVVQGPSPPSEIRRFVRDRLRSREGTDTLLIEDVLSGFAALSGIQDAGRTVPHEVMLAVFDSIPSPGLVNPPLTHIAIPHAKLVEYLVAQLLAQIHDPLAEPVSQSFPGQVMIRPSTLRKQGWESPQTAIK